MHNTKYTFFDRNSVFFILYKLFFKAQHILEYSWKKIIVVLSFVLPGTYKPVKETQLGVPT